MKKLYIFSLLMLIFIANDTYAPGQAPIVGPVKFGVVVGVTCDDEFLKDLIESHIKRELRALHDVEIVDLWGESDTYQLLVVVLEQTSESGQKTGLLAISTLYIRKVPIRVLEPYLSDPFPVGILHDEKIPLPLYGAPLMRISTVGKEKVLQYVQSIIAGFDVQVLEPERKKR